MRRWLLLLAAGFVAVAALGSAQDEPAIALRIVGALKLGPGERVLLRYDPGDFGGLVGPLRRLIRERGGVDVAAVEYGEVPAIPATTTGPAFEARRAAFLKLLEAVDIYLWLPVRAGVREIDPAEARALQQWLDMSGRHREIHFHWSAGSVDPDGLAGAHPAAYERLYRDALDIDYSALSAAQDRAIEALRSGIVRVRTPGGTDLRFRVGDRPFNRQNGDASGERAEAARVRVDREIELPAGVVRVAPLEDTAEGRIYLPAVRFGDVRAEGVRLTIEKGRVVRVEALSRLDAVEAALDKGGEAARRFREFGLGLNPKLTAPAEAAVLPYYGYGAGVVRLSLGDNREIGGNVTGDFVRWFFFPDATVDVGGRVLVQDGRLVAPAR